MVATRLLSMICSLITRLFFFLLYNSSWHTNTRSDTRKGASFSREHCCTTCQDKQDRQTHSTSSSHSSGDLPHVVLRPFSLFVFVLSLHCFLASFLALFH
ncbi:MAG: hypothetical protein BYD32DRAFT_244355 [Podila humilis]|nr:MAG: hypothetical protein BYD32DRAFT_244355 [Podila humilis]